ncbi:MAG: hypothetical protein Q9219_003972 [cf. Caloplaca sp. 3 TL-2023]
MTDEEEEDIPAFELTEKDRQNLARQDEDFQPHTWKDLQEIVATNDLKSLRRWPSDLRRYLYWTKQTKRTYGTITNFLCRERLHWTPLPTSDPNFEPTFRVTNPIPFADARDYKILYNDWPYGLAPGISHLIVWLKTRFAVSPDCGDLLPEARKSVERFVDKIFRNGVEKEEGGKGSEAVEVMWFRNWTGLQSVRGIDHIHILVRGASREIMDRWTGGEHVVTAI